MAAGDADSAPPGVAVAVNLKVGDLTVVGGVGAADVAPIAPAAVVLIATTATMAAHRL
ncbi:MAG: hypothetical protein HN557_04510 [Rhodospirillaceae bacterium]|nr:hypothetical protein [Rhodospirillaceae bacterium]